MKIIKESFQAKLVHDKPLQKEMWGNKYIITLDRVFGFEVGKTYDFVEKHIMFDGETFFIDSNLNPHLAERWEEIK